MKGPSAPGVQDEWVAPSLQRSDGLLRVDARWTLAQAARYCRAQGWVFPLARPLPPLQLGLACSQYPIFADAFVAEVHGDVMEESISTPSAPRAAMGPDLLGGIMVGTPLFRARILLIRVFDAARTRVRHERFSSCSSASERIVNEMSDGRAFAVDAFVEEGSVHLNVLEAAATGPQIDTKESVFASSPRIRPRSGRSILPGDAAGIASALENQARVVAAPFMGRVGRLDSTLTESGKETGGELAGACTALAERLCHASAQGEGP